MVWKIGQFFSVMLFIASLTFVGSSSAKAAQNVSANPGLIEVFTSTDLLVTGEGYKTSKSKFSKVSLQIFELDGIKQIEDRLSQGLSADPVESRQVVLERFQQLTREDRIRIRNAATGMAKAAQYGVDRYPAIVFDGLFVVYGITDIHSALIHLQQWQAGQKP